MGLKEDLDLLTIQEVADYMGVSKNTAYRYLQAKPPLPATRFSRKILYVKRQDIINWLESKAEGTGQV